MRTIGDIKNRVDRLEEEIIEIKRVLIKSSTGNKKKSKAAWKDLVKASSEISRKWSGHGAVEEIRKQRTK